MELKDTAAIMNNESYEERFKAEYWQLKIRIDKLKKMLDDWKEDKLNFEPKTSRSILEKQLDYMQKYLVLLEARAIAEDIDLKRVEKNNMNAEKIQIKYFDNEIDKIQKIEKGNWIDLRAAETVNLHKGEFHLIPLGVGMKLPEGYEANIVPRSSTYKNFKILQTNSFGM